MDLINCSRCGKLTIKRTSSFCDACFMEQKEELDKIKDYLEKNPNSTILDVHNNTGISLSTINELLKNNMIEYRQG